MDHDRLFKELLTAFFADFLDGCIPGPAAATTNSSSAFWGSVPRRPIIIGTWAGGGEARAIPAQIAELGMKDKDYGKTKCHDNLY